MNSLFGPLSHSYCNLFLFLSFLGLVALFMVVIAGLVLLSKKGMTSLEGFYSCRPLWSMSSCTSKIVSSTISAKWFK